MEIPVQLKNDIVAYLTSLPNMMMMNVQQALVMGAGLDPQLLSQLNFGLPPAPFFQILLATFSSYGRLHDGREPIEALLQASKEFVGPDNQGTCDDLIREWTAVRGGRTAPTSKNNTRRNATATPASSAIPFPLLQKYEEIMEAQTDKAHSEAANQPEQQFTRVVTGEAPIKILFLAANPIDTVRLRVDAEAREIDQVLRNTDFRENFELIRHGAVRIRDLTGLLIRHKPTIMHFSGHGSRESEIKLENDSGKAQAVPAQALSRLFSVLKDNIRCVVLNACFSERQAQAIAEHIDCVIGMSEAIGDKSALKFSAAFYEALGYGRHLKDAFDLGCLQIHMEGLKQQEIPQLIAAHPEDIVFVEAA